MRCRINVKVKAKNCELKVSTTWLVSSDENMRSCQSIENVAWIFSSGILLWSLYVTLVLSSLLVTPFFLKANIILWSLKEHSSTILHLILLALLVYRWLIRADELSSTLVGSLSSWDNPNGMITLLIHPALALAFFKSTLKSPKAMISLHSVEHCWPCCKTNLVPVNKNAGRRVQIFTEFEWQGILDVTHSGAKPSIRTESIKKTRIMLYIIPVLNH